VTSFSHTIASRETRRRRHGRSYKAKQPTRLQSLCRAQFLPARPRIQIRVLPFPARSSSGLGLKPSEHLQRFDIGRSRQSRLHRQEFLDADPESRHPWARPAGHGSVSSTSDRSRAIASMAIALTVNRPSRHWGANPRTFFVTKNAAHGPKFLISGLAKLRFVESSSASSINHSHAFVDPEHPLVLAAPLGPCFLYVPPNRFRRNELRFSSEPFLLSAVVLL